MFCKPRTRAGTTEDVLRISSIDRFNLAGSQIIMNLRVDRGSTRVFRFHMSVLCMPFRLLMRPRLPRTWHPVCTFARERGS